MTSTLLVFLQLCKAQQSIYTKTGRGDTPKYTMCHIITRTGKLLTCDFRNLTHQYMRRFDLKV